MVLRMLVRWSLGSVPRSQSSPLSTSRTSMVVLAMDRVGLKASEICTGRQGIARQAKNWWTRT